MKDVLDGLNDPFAVLDPDWKFVYLNPAAVEVMGGKVGEGIWDHFPDAVGSEANRLLIGAMSESETVEFMVRPGEFGLNTEAWFNIRAYPVPEGLAVIAWDATAARAAREERDELYQAKSMVARVLQQALLPPALPEIPGVELGASYLASGEGVDVGGDFYDVFAVENDGWALVMGDVTGKGPEAASLTSLARYAIRASAMRVKRPRKVLGQLNEEIMRQTGGDRLFTAVFAELEPCLGEAGSVVLRVACAGHPSPVVVTRDGISEALDDTGTILGAIPEPEFSYRELELGAGDVIVFYTDGVTEARRENGDFFGVKRLLEVLSGCRGMSAGEIAGTVQRAATGFRDDELEDDVAVLALRVSGERTPATEGI